MALRLGEMLVEDGLITQRQLAWALGRQKACGDTLSRVLVDLGFVKGEEITAFLSWRYGVPLVDLDHFEIDPALSEIIPPDLALKHKVLSLCRSGPNLTIALADPAGASIVDDIKFMTGYSVEVVVASEAGIEGALRCKYRTSSYEDWHAARQTELDTRALIDRLSENGDAPPAGQLLWLITLDSIAFGASEVHIRRGRAASRVSYRLKGKVAPAGAFPVALHDQVVRYLRLKIRVERTDPRVRQDASLHMRLTGPEPTTVSGEPGRRLDRPALPHLREPAVRKYP